MSIEGKKREFKENSKFVGLFEAKVVAINPNLDEMEDKLGFQTTEDSKEPEYQGESKEGNSYLRVDFWLEEIKEEKKKFKVSFFL